MITRFDSLKTGNKLKLLPDVDPFGYMIDLLKELGPLDKGEEISWQEIQAWQSITGTPLSLWEAKTLKTLSKTFASAINEYKGNPCSSPLAADIEDKKTVAKNIRNTLRAFNGSKSD